MKRYRARWIYTGQGLPIENASIEIADGRVARVDTAPSDADDLGQVAILPGLINAHTHLEFSTISAPLEPLRDFADWIRSVIHWRRESAGNPLDAISDGLNESLHRGVTCLGEIATTDWRFQPALVPQLKRVGAVRVFREFLGLNEDLIATHLHTARSFLSQPLPSTSSPCLAALSPHAPYSLHPALFDGLCSLAEEFHVPIAMHLAESPGELELLHNGTGPLMEMLTALGVYRPELFAEPQCPLDFLARLDCGVPVLVVHGNLLTERELQFLAARPLFSVIYCPRTHAVMQQQTHPWQRMQELGINLALGTDSRASNPDLSIWNELCFLHQKYPEIPSTKLLQLATMNAAHALQLPLRGGLQIGNWADICIVQLNESAKTNPEQFLFAQGNQPIGTMVNGDWAIVPPSLIP